MIPMVIEKSILREISFETVVISEEEYGFPLAPET
jgi:hypothetical protein